MRKRCPECGFPNAEGEAFCECGYEFVGHERPTGGGRRASFRDPDVERRRQAAMEQPVPQRGSGRGALVGALLGGILRPVVVLLYGYLDPHGFAAHPNFGCIFTEIGLPIAVVLALVDGLWIGAISGYLANPYLGAAVGFLLSACTCAFFVRELIVVFWMWVLLMGLMGAIAGGVGGFIGWHAKQAEKHRAWGEERFEDD